MENIKNKLHTLNTKREMYRDNINTLNDELDELQDTLNAVIVVREVIQKATQLTQEELGTRLSDIVSQALGLVFSNLNLGFSAQFVTRRNSTECDMYITEDGEEYDPLSSCGFGAADVASFALRVAMWALNRTDNLMIFDEPFRNLGSDDMPQAALLLSTLSEELGIQMLVVTHEADLMNNAGKAYQVTKVGKHSKVVAINAPN